LFHLSKEKAALGLLNLFLLLFPSAHYRSAIGPNWAMHLESSNLPMELDYGVDLERSVVVGVLCEAVIIQHHRSSCGIAGLVFADCPKARSFSILDGCKALYARYCWP
jgi:hypothetical protein